MEMNLLYHVFPASNPDGAIFRHTVMCLIQDCEKMTGDGVLNSLQSRQPTPTRRAYDGRREKEQERTALRMD